MKRPPLPIRDPKIRLEKKLQILSQDEQRAYLNGYEMGVVCVEKYLTEEGKQKLKCMLMTIRNVMEKEDDNGD